MSLLVDLTIRMSIIVVVALGVSRALTHHSAALRHWVLTLGLACAAATPLLHVALPSWNAGLRALQPVALPEQHAGDIAIAMDAATVSTPEREAASLAPSASPRRPLRPFPILLISVWLAGAVVSLASLGVGLSRLAKLASRASRVETGRLAAIAAEVRAALDVRQRVLLLQSTDSTLLVTWGAARPKVLLPADASHWLDERIRVVLEHEFAHVARGDWIVQLLGEALRAAFWFNPLLWIACRRLRHESERACDDVVLGGGVAPADYASHLLELARSAARRRPGPALAMARPSMLEGRVTAMLNARTARHPLTRAARIATFIMFAAVAVPVATAQNRPWAFAGTVVDQTNRFVPGAELVLTSVTNGARHEGRTNQIGRFTFPELLPGDYQLTVQRPGFKTFTENVTVADADVSRVIHLQIGSLQETLTVADGGRGPGQPPAQRSTGQASQQQAQRTRQIASDKCGSGPTTGEVGGQIVPPAKLTHVHPEYPDTLKATGTKGSVTLDAIIGIDGKVRDVAALSSPHPELERVAIDAVRQWQFSTTYLNCTPVEVPMRVTLKFVTQP